MLRPPNPKLNPIQLPPSETPALVPLNINNLENLSDLLKYVHVTLSIRYQHGVLYWRSYQAYCNLVDSVSSFDAHTHLIDCCVKR